MTAFASSLFSNLSIDPTSLAITVFVLCLSLSFHEFSHAWMANRLGDDTAALQGRLTLNPLRHLDPVGTILFLIAGIGWAKPVPINPTRFSREVNMKTGIMKVSLAGPVSNLILATISCLLLFIVVTIEILSGNTGSVLEFFVLLTKRLYGANIILAVFNLLPIPPLDGYKVFGSLLPNELYYKIMQYERYIGLVFLGIVMFGRGALGTVLSYIQIPFNYVIFKPINFLFQQLWTLF